MALDHRQAAQEILDAVGGAGSVVSAAHCATRLRLVIADDSKVDQAKVDAAVGAKGNFKASGLLLGIMSTISFMNTNGIIAVDTSSTLYVIADLVSGTAFTFLQILIGYSAAKVFGANLRFFKPFIAGCIGGGAGAWICAITHLAASGTGVTGIFGILLCLSQPVQYVVMFAATAAVAFAVSFILYRDLEPHAPRG